MSETQIQSEILEWLKANFILAFRVPLGGVKHAGVRKRSPMRGFPDVFGVIPNTKGRMFCIEVKTETGKLSDIQKEMIFNLERDGVVVIVARSVSDVSTFFLELR